jgi:iron complex transport system permease protein
MRMMTPTSTAAGGTLVLATLSTLALATLVVVHIATGANWIVVPDVLAAFFSYDPENFEHVTVISMRFPRAILAGVAGAALSVAGALMQGVTRNPLADPGVLGLLAGASLAVVIFTTLFPSTSPAFFSPIAAFGAVGAAALVWGISVVSRNGSNPTTLVLAGAAVTALFSAGIAMISLLDEQRFEEFRVWLTGSLAGRRFDVLAYTLPWILLGLGIALGISRQVTSLAMGDDVARGLGVNLKRLKILILVSVVILTAASVPIAGPLGLAGLIVPHITRLLFGHDYRRIVPFSAVIGACYLIFVDIAARVVFAPAEVSTGIMAALIGCPFFIWLVRTRL